MSIQVYGWIPFKMRKDYPKIEGWMVELPEEDCDILVWNIGKTDLSGVALRQSSGEPLAKTDPQIAVWMARYRKDYPNEEKFIVAVYGYDTYLEEEREFDVADDDFPFLAWLPIPDISNVLGSAYDYPMPSWWDNDEEETDLPDIATLKGINKED